MGPGLLSWANTDVQLPDVRPKILARGQSASFFEAKHLTAIEPSAGAGL